MQRIKEKATKFFLEDKAFPSFVPQATSSHQERLDTKGRGPQKMHLPKF